MDGRTRDGGYLNGAVSCFTANLKRLCEHSTGYTTGDCCKLHTNMTSMFQEARFVVLACNRGEGSVPPEVNVMHA